MINFVEDHALYMASFHDDNTFKMSNYGKRISVKGNWFLSDSLLFLKITYAEQHDCLSSEISVFDDSTQTKLMNWKIVKIDSSSFTCTDYRKRLFRKTTITANRNLSSEN